MASTTQTNRWLIARWATAAAILLIPVIAMQFRSGFAWSTFDFVVAAVLLFGSLGAYEVLSRMRSGWAYRTGLAVGIGASFLLLWVNGAVGITDGSADAVYPVAVAVAAVGALVARFRPGGMARAMWAAAITMVLVSVTALAAGLVPAFNAPFEVIGITLFFVVLFAGAAVLFGEAATSASDEAAAS